MIPCVLANLALQGHLISSQLFVLKMFFVFVELKLKVRFFALGCPRVSRFGLRKFFLRDFCEVEFWEVLQMKKVRGCFLTMFPFGCSPVDCQIADLEMDYLFGVTEFLRFVTWLRAYGFGIRRQ